MPDHHRLPILPAEEEAARQSAEAVNVRLLDDVRPTKGLMQVGDLAREAGKTVRAIHLYEELGLLTPASALQGALPPVRSARRSSASGGSASSRTWASAWATSRPSCSEWERAGSAPHAMKRMREVYARKLEETRSSSAACRPRARADGEPRVPRHVRRRLRAAAARLGVRCCDLHDKDRARARAGARRPGH